MKHEVTNLQTKQSMACALKKRMEKQSLSEITDHQQHRDDHRVFPAADSCFCGREIQVEAQDRTVTAGLPDIC